MSGDVRAAIQAALDAIEADDWALAELILEGLLEEGDES